MATSLLYVCDCGALLTVYVPKRVFFGDWLAPLINGEIEENWAAIDAQEEQAGEIDLLRGYAKEFNAAFVDGRAGLLCPVCRAGLGLEREQRAIAAQYVKGKNARLN